MASLLPKADLKLRATAVPFAVPGTERAVVAIALGLKQPPLVSRMSDSVEVVTKIFTSDGHERGSDVQTIPITVPAARAEATDSRYEVLARVEVPRPGRYELRLSALSTVSNTRGSVYVDVTVPDFRRDRVSLSGVVLSTLPAPGPVAPPRALNDLTPLPPTAERSFGAGELVTAFVRVYQGGNDKPAPVAMTIRLIDAQDAPVFEHAETLPPERFGAPRAADYQVRLPLEKLAAGSYLLTLDAAINRSTATRQVVVQVR
jgi:hypothetical protein